MIAHSPFRPFFDHRYLVLLLLFTGLIFFKGVTVSFSSDDFVHLENNIHYEDLSSAAEVFVKPFGREYRPLVRLSLWLNHQMGDTALPYKISNLLMHLLCILLMYGLLLRLGVSKTATLIASSIFALHPIHITSIHFILGRTDLIAAVFYLATLYCFSHWKNNSSMLLRLLTSLWFVAALLSKELSITLPVMMLAISIVQQKTLAIPAIIRSGIRLWPYILMTAIYLVARLYQWKTMEEAVAVYTNYSPLNIVKNYLGWGFALVYPFDLYVAREWLLLHNGLFIACALIIAAALILGAIYIWRGALKNLLGSPLLWLGLAWLLITLVPMSGGSSHRWYLYLPSVGFSWVIAIAWANAPQNRKAILNVALTLLLLIYSVESLRQSLDWDRQSDINEFLLSERQTQALLEHETIAIANMPFGYKGTFLFTHSSFEEALRVRYGKSPRIQVLNYVNLDKENTIDSERSPAEAIFTIAPTAYRYFRSRDSRVFFPEKEADIYGEFKIHTEELDEIGRVVSLRLELPEHPRVPIYYFDGNEFKELD